MLAFSSSPTARNRCRATFDGDYPKWKPIYDTVLSSSDINVLLPTADVQQAAKRVAAMSDPNALFTLRFDEDELTISSVIDGRTPQQTVFLSPTPATSSPPVTNHDYFVCRSAHAEGDVRYRSSYARNHAGDVVKEKRTPCVLTPQMRTAKENSPTSSCRSPHKETAATVKGSP